MIFIVIIVAIIMFLIGFWVGVKKEPPIKKQKFESKPSYESEILKTEYENFLNYDGSVQQ